MKTIVIGASNAGKTTTIRYLREKYSLPISEIDEELTKANNGEYPCDINLKNNVLAPMIKQKVIESGDILFFSNTNYFDINDLKEAKEKGFKIVQLEVALEKLLVRNKGRMENEGYPDNGEWIKGMVEYQKEIFDAGVVDKVINAEMKTEEIAEEILRHCEE